jgi:hypothetical protein
MPPFDWFYFIDLDADKTGYQRTFRGNRPDIEIHTGDANEYLIRQLLPTIRHKRYNLRPRALSA